MQINGILKKKKKIRLTIKIILQLLDSSQVCTIITPFLMILYLQRQKLY